MKIRITGNQMQEEMLQERWQKLADWHESFCQRILIIWVQL